MIERWLVKEHMRHYFDDVSNTKHPAKYYIDDHALRFEKGKKESWDFVLNFIDADNKKG